MGRTAATETLSAAPETASSWAKTQPLLPSASCTCHQSPAGVFPIRSTTASGGSESRKSKAVSGPLRTLAGPVARPWGRVGGGVGVGSRLSVAGAGRGGAAVGEGNTFAAGSVGSVVGSVVGTVVGSVVGSAVGRGGDAAGSWGSSCVCWLLSAAASSARADAAGSASAARVSVCNISHWRGLATSRLFSAAWALSRSRSSAYSCAIWSATAARSASVSADDPQAANRTVQRETARTQKTKEILLWQQTWGKGERPQDGVAQAQRTLSILTNPDVDARPPQPFFRAIARSIYTSADRSAQTDQPRQISPSALVLDFFLAGYRCECNGSEKFAACIGQDFVLTGCQQARISAILEESQACPARVWCRRWESNPHGFPHTILSRARLPVPPLRHKYELW